MTYGTTYKDCKCCNPNRSQVVVLLNREQLVMILMTMVESYSAVVMTAGWPMDEDFALGTVFITISMTNNSVSRRSVGVTLLIKPSKRL